MRKRRNYWELLNWLLWLPLILSFQMSLMSRSSISQLKRYQDWPSLYKLLLRWLFCKSKRRFRKINKSRLTHNDFSLTERFWKIVTHAWLQRFLKEFAFKSMKVRTRRQLHRDSFNRNRHIKAILLVEWELLLLASQDLIFKNLWMESTLTSLLEYFQTSSEFKIHHLLTDLDDRYLEDHLLPLIK